MSSQSLIDRSQLRELNETAQKIAASAAMGDWKKATEEWSTLEDAVEEKTSGVNFYNIQDWGKVESTYKNEDMTAIGKNVFKL